MKSPYLAAVRSIAIAQLDLIQGTGRPITKTDIESAVASATAMSSPLNDGEVIDETELVRALESDFNVFVGQSNSLSDDNDHIRWLPDRHDGIDWALWSRYERYTRNVGLAPAAVDRLDEITDDILGRLEDPTRPGPWDRRGLVAGQVQSGKTGNYTGLICKALDAGYKLVVVLAGVHNSLRSQTQSRIDEGVLGFDTRKNLRADEKESRRIGVGQLAGRFIHVHSFTQSSENGDFSKSVAEKINVAVGGSDPVVLVVKKNKSILQNLRSWATELRKEVDPETNKIIVRGVPVLVIDDEADHASVDTNGPRRGASSDDEIDPSVINGLIRSFLNTFEQTAYVAYTATPFANIFIDPDAVHSDAGEDLFPRSFIVNLPAPSNYIGPVRVFGLEEDLESGIDYIEPLPIVDTISDYASWMPDRHKADHVPPSEIPSSLRRAILSFLIADAVRSFRGQGKVHNSMLIHVTRYVEVQRLVTAQVMQEVQEIAARLQYGEGSNPTLRQEIEELYLRRFIPATKVIASDPELVDQAGELPSFDVLMELLPGAAKKTRVRMINGKSDDAFEYVDHPEGVSVIAVGGDKLSRGLTLEGLTVSYYLRSTKMYDTLMQMGRWFGYRTGYLDLCRLYTTQELQDWYVAITAAAEELQREFDYMAAIGETPEKFGLRVKQHPDGLLVTSPTKLRHAKKVSISFAGTISESILFSRDLATREANWSAFEKLVAAMGGPTQSNPKILGGTRVWSGISSDVVIRFLSEYRAHPDSIKAQPSNLKRYIQSRTSDSPSELTDWTVVVADNEHTGQNRRTYPLSGMKVGLIRRSQWPTESEDRALRYSIRRLVSPPHERVDLHGEPERMRKAMDLTEEAWAASTRKGKKNAPPSAPSGPAVRAVRDPSKGVLILYPLDPRHVDVTDSGPPYVGFAISFPASERAKPIEYQVNDIYWSQQLRRLGALEDDDLE